MEYNPFFRKPYYYPQNIYAQNSRRGDFNRPHSKEPTTANVGATFRRPHFEENTQTNRNKSKETNQLKTAPIFEIFGLKLYFDDILIITLLFFLYEEGVEDNLLFISLILLLLS